MKIIGITGTIGAGKGTIVEYLVKKKNFKHYSVREFLIEEIEKRNLPVNRDSMVIVANDLRTTFSPSYIVEQLYERAKENDNDCIIESLRSVGEVEALRKKGNFTLLAIDADAKVRYERIRKRGNETDDISYETFLENEKREMNSSDPAKQNLSECIAMADFKIMNDRTVEQLYKQVEKILTTND